MIVHDLAGQVVLLGEREPVADVRGDDQRRERRLRLVVRVLAACLVLEEDTGRAILPTSW